MELPRFIILACLQKPKRFLDRLLPINLPAIDIHDDGTNGHPSRYDLSHQRHILISTCGFASIKAITTVCFSNLNLCSMTG